MHRPVIETWLMHSDPVQQNRRVENVSTHPGCDELSRARCDDFAIFRAIGDECLKLQSVPKPQIIAHYFCLSVRLYYHD